MSSTNKKNFEENFTSHFNKQNIDNNIVEIFNESIIEDFINQTECKYCSSIFYMKNKENFYEYLENIIEDVFNTDDRNIFHLCNKDYTLDFKTSIFLLKTIKNWLVDEYEQEESFCSIFDDDTNSESKIINLYAYEFVRIDRFDIIYDVVSRLLKNIAKYNFHKNKHSGLINLYKKLDKKNKQKNTISKILINKFDTDILDNILHCY